MVEKLHFWRSLADRNTYLVTLGTKLYGGISKRSGFWDAWDDGGFLLYRGRSLVEARGAVIDAWVAEIEGGK